MAGLWLTTSTWSNGIPRGNPNTGETGGIIEKEAPIQLSNLAIYNPVTKKGDRVGFKTLEDGRKVRYFKSNNEVVDLG